MEREGAPFLDTGAVSHHIVVVFFFCCQTEQVSVTVAEKEVAVVVDSDKGLAVEVIVAVGICTADGFLDGAAADPRLLAQG